MGFNISRPLYPSPTWYRGAVVAGQVLAVTTTLVKTFSTFNTLTEQVAFDVQAQNVYVTVDGTTPSSTNGHILYAGSAFTWSKAGAQQAKFLCTTTAGDAQIYASEWTN